MAKPTVAESDDAKPIDDKSVDDQQFATVGGGDNWCMLELSYVHLPRGAHGIYKHILFYWYPTFFAKKTPTFAKKLILNNFPRFCP